MRPDEFGFEFHLLAQDWTKFDKDSVHTEANEL